jgi:hypothetical protein
MSEIAEYVNKAKRKNEETTRALAIVQNIEDYKGNEALLKAERKYIGEYACYILSFQDGVCKVP